MADNVVGETPEKDACQHANINGDNENLLDKKGRIRERFGLR